MKTRQTSPSVTTGSSRTTRSRTSQNASDEMRDEIIDWLRDAYAMERGLEAALQKQSQKDELSPSVRQRAAAHLEETRRHAEEVKAALESLGTDTSKLKTGVGVTLQGMKGMASKFASDERIKDLLDSYSMEHFEIACYLALASGAEAAGLNEVAEMCRRIIPDEERMAQALRQALPQEVHSYLFQAAAEV